LHLAVVKGHLEIVKYLVQEDAKLDAVDNELRTPLIKAVLSGNQNPQLNYQICQVLLNGGAGTCKSIDSRNCSRICKIVSQERFTTCPRNSVKPLRFGFDHNSEMEGFRELSHGLN